MSTIEERPESVPSRAITHDYSKRMMVFGGRSSMELAAKVAGKLDVDLGQVTLKTFANGEVYCRYEESIRGADVFIVQSTCANEHTGMTPNDSLIELLTMIDAAQGASAHRIIAVMPWYGYARQDKKSAPREPISARIVAKCLEGVGVDRVLTMDLHAGQVQGFFHVPVDHMTAMPMLTQWFADQHLSRGPGDRLARRRPGEDGAQLRPPHRHPLGGDGEGAPGPAGGRDRLRGRRRQGQDRGPGRRHDRHRRHPLRRRPDGARRGRGAGDRLRHPRRLLRPRLRAARLRELRRSSRSSSPTRSRCAPAPRTTSPCSRPPAPSPTRSAASSPTTRSPRSSPARTSSSSAAREPAPGRPQGGRPDRARQHARELRRRRSRPESTRSSSTCSGCATRTCRWSSGHRWSSPTTGTTPQSRTPLTLTEALDAFLEPPLDKVEIDLDIKLPGPRGGDRRRRCASAT